MTSSSSTTSISPLHSASGAGFAFYCAPVPARGEEHSQNFRLPENGRPAGEEARRRAAVVVAFGLKPERIVGAEGRIDAVPEPPSAEQAGLLVEALRSGLEAGGTVIAIVPEWFPPAGLQRLQMARVLLHTRRAAGAGTPPPPPAPPAPAPPG